MRKNSRYRRIAGVILFLLMTVMIPFRSASASDGYNYDRNDETYAAPDAYEWSASLRAEDLGVESLDGISDMFYRNGRLYVAMRGRILVLDSEFRQVMVIEDNVTYPRSVFVTDEGAIYTAEQSLGAIVEYDANGNYVRSLTNPEITGLGDVTYQPVKAVVDDAGRIYVKAQSVYEGIIELDPEGNFRRFIGANDVNPSLLEIFYRSIATDEQISRMQLWLPTDYSDITLDFEGYLLATIQEASSEEPIRKLNGTGEDVMKKYEYITGPLGDYEGSASISTLISVASAEDGRFAALDSQESRIFVYSEDGLLAYTLGGSGSGIGDLSSPVDIAFMEDYILVADTVTASIEVFSPTEYGNLINVGLRYQRDYDYASAAECWRQICDITPASIIANMGMGRYYMRTGEYEAAMASYERTGERSFYSDAFGMVRDLWMEDNLGGVFLAIIGVIVALCLIVFVIRKLSKKGVFEGKGWVKVLRKIRYNAFTWPGYMMSKPFKAFDDVKYEGAGSVGFSFVILVLFAWTAVIKAQYGSFVVNDSYGSRVNIPMVLVSTVLPYLIFIVGNWAVCVLIDGKGNMKSIFKVLMYALYPSIYLNIAATLLSQVITSDEIALYGFLVGLGTVLFVFYTFVGLVMIHQFTFSKAVGSIILSAVAMVIIIFIGVLVVTLLTDFVNDIGTIIDEVRLVL